MNAEILHDSNFGYWIVFPSHLFVGDELRADWVVLGLPEDVVEAEDGALPLLEPHVLLRAAQQDLVRRRRRRDILKTRLTV